jgi:hypothetical protein
VPDVFFRVGGDGTVLGYHARRGAEGVPSVGWIPGQHIGQALPEPVAGPGAGGGAFRAHEPARSSISSTP